MRYVYSRLVDPAAALLPGPANAGGLARVRGLPHRRAWIDRASRSASADLWGDMAFTALAPQCRPQRPGPDHATYILQQDPCGLWFVDDWADSVGTIRPARPLAPMAASAAVAGSRELGNTCFIIELEHATRR